MTVKMTFSLPDQCAARVRAAVSSGEAPSASAYVAGLIAAATEEDSWEKLMADMDAEFGAPTRADKAWAKSEWERTARELEGLKKSGWPEH